MMYHTTVWNLHVSAFDYLFDGAHNLGAALDNYLFTKLNDLGSLQDGGFFNTGNMIGLNECVSSTMETAPNACGTPRP
jgi:hypothetical protein